ncbi:MAG: hypothetical protein M3256_18535 [Actinomycetota bacterium]|nr:hypothetical protein [Actinomycetota bacterium]
MSHAAAFLVGSRALGTARQYVGLLHALCPWFAGVLVAVLIAGVVRQITESPILAASTLHDHPRPRPNRRLRRRSTAAPVRSPRPPW